MDTLMHADIFFFITTVAVVLVAFCALIILIYVIQILHRARKIADLVHEETILFRKDIEALRTSVKVEGFKLKSVIRFIRRLLPLDRSKRSRE